MTPDQLAKSGTEHGEQRALFQWAKMAEVYGFQAAWNDEAYTGSTVPHIRNPVSELRRMFAIPNGGLRDKITASKLKTEGVKKGVPDIFLPLPMPGYAGLFIELKRVASETRTAGGAKRRAGSASTEQEDWATALRHVGYGVTIAVGWREAAQQIQSYVEAVRNIA